MKSSKRNGEAKGFRKRQNNNDYNFAFKKHHHSYYIEAALFSQILLIVFGLWPNMIKSC
jgi:hypothetical protein